MAWLLFGVAVSFMLYLMMFLFIFLCFCYNYLFSSWSYMLRLFYHNVCSGFVHLSMRIICKFWFVNFFLIILILVSKQTFLSIVHFLLSLAVVVQASLPSELLLQLFPNSLCMNLSHCNPLGSSHMQMMFRPYKSSWHVIFLPPFIDF